MKKKFKLVLIIVLALFLQAFALVGVQSPAAAQNVDLPYDESPHPDSVMEWWYFTGHLEGTDIFGNPHQYGFEETIVRIDAFGTEPAGCIYNGQLAISDITRSEFKQKMDWFSMQADVIPPGGGFNNTVGGVHMNGKNGVNHCFATFPDLSYSINLTLSQSDPSALHGDTGLIPYGPFGTSYYYSQTRLNVTGYIIDHGVVVNVTGIAWQDHQWGDFDGTGGWDWFSIQLDDNTEYMLYFITDANKQVVEKVGTLVNADGTTTNLAPSSISRTPLDTWTSQNSGLTYDQDWTVNVPGGTLTVTPQLEDQELWSELFAMMGGAGAYWEGSCTVTGTINGSPVTGQAYVELTPTCELPISIDILEIIENLLGL